MELGVMVNLREGVDFALAFAEAQEAGFTHGQVNFYMPGLTADEVREIALASHAAKFHVDAAGCYMNPLRPDETGLDEPCALDWKTLAENMAMLNGCERIVCWSGTLGKTLATPNLLNQEEATFNNLYIALAGLLEQTRGIPVQLILEPFSAHVLHDAASCRRIAAKFPGGEVKVVLDAPNVLSLHEFAHRDAHVLEFVRQVAPAVGLVHLKDVSRDDAGNRLFHAPGHGALDYGRYLRAIVEHIPAVPILVENVGGVDEMRQAREFLEAQLKAQEL